MRFYYRRGGKGAAPEGFDRVYTEVDGDGNVLRELLAYVRADDSVTVEMDGELGGTAGAFVEMALALYRQQATLLCKSPKIDTAAGHWQAVLSDLALLTSRDTGDAARLSRFMEGLHRCFDLVERRQMSIGKTTYYRYWRKIKSAPQRERHTELFEELRTKIEANELSISAACRQMNIGAGTYYRMRDQYKKERSVPNVPNSE